MCCAVCVCLHVFAVQMTHDIPGFPCMTFITLIQACSSCSIVCDCSILADGLIWDRQCLIEDRAACGRGASSMRVEDCAILINEPLLFLYIYIYDSNCRTELANQCIVSFVLLVEAHVGAVVQDREVFSCKV